MAIVLSYHGNGIGPFLTNISLLIALGIFIVMILFDREANKKMDSIKEDLKQLSEIKEDLKQLSEITQTLLRIERLLERGSLGPGKPPGDSRD